MDVTELPFNRFLGLELAEARSGYLVCLPEGPQYLNHVGTVHASALLAVAEAGSGAFLLQEFGSFDGLFPVVRQLQAKFRKPARGRLCARGVGPISDLAKLRDELLARGRIFFSVVVEVVDAEGVVVLTATVEWFIAKAPGNSA